MPKYYLPCEIDTSGSLKGQKDFFLNVSNTPINSFALDLVIPGEVKLEISRTPIGKSHGPYSCPTRILKCSANAISSILAQILNPTISTGVIIKLLKWQRSFLFLKQMTIRMLTIIGLFLCYLIFIKFLRN